MILNANGLNTPIKIQRLSKWTKNMTQLYVYKKSTLNARIRRDEKQMAEEKYTMVTLN